MPKLYYDTISFYNTTGFKDDNIVYSFSDREISFEGDGDDLSSHFLAGLGNFGSVAAENANYAYVITDNTSKQMIKQVYVCERNSKYTSSEYADKLSQIYMNGKKVEDNNGPAYIEFSGLISDIDYEAIYDYANGLTDEFPACIGNLRCYYQNTLDDNIILIKVIS